MENQIDEYYFREGKKYEIIMPRDAVPGDFIRTHTYEGAKLVSIVRIKWVGGVEVPSSFIIGNDGKRYSPDESSLCLRLKVSARNPAAAMSPLGDG